MFHLLLRQVCMPITFILFLSLSPLHNHTQTLTLACSHSLVLVLHLNMSIVGGGWYVYLCERYVYFAMCGYILQLIASAYRSYLFIQILCIWHSGKQLHLLVMKILLNAT